MLLEKLKKLSDNFHMSIEQTYYSFNLNDNINIFIESFDGINFTIIGMNRLSLHMRTLAEINAKDEVDLNQKISQVVNSLYDLSI